MSRREKTRIAAKRRPQLVPSSQSDEPRHLAKHPLQQRGHAAPERLLRAHRHRSR